MNSNDKFQELLEDAKYNSSLSVSKGSGKIVGKRILRKYSLEINRNIGIVHYPNRDDGLVIPAIDKDFLIGILRDFYDEYSKRFVEV